ncbi:uncharacterized protein BJ212DRAFT_1476609 [Suillus subaureus]|uniref:Uncharacterized protein n=1 Tax=Suillus subaureus TaxID=48587 RepID=A0A9P7EJG9_9AGAM|nr:uncharacterized protein BJ212DRAFT_1476609 [Suillus subaureus]KAG1823733.1 hypothetical protein BJ212DRAFT_1476609 [Suillus subaureus]
MTMTKRRRKRKKLHPLPPLRRLRPASKARNDIQSTFAGTSTLDPIMDSEKDEQEEEELANDILTSE